MDTSVIPSTWLSVLKRAQLVDPDAVLAGGAMRDLYFQREVKDLDIFVHAHRSVDWDLYAAALDTAYGVPGKCKVSRWASSYVFSDGEVSAVYEHNIMGCHTINTIVLNWPITMGRLLRRLDFGACQIGTKYGEIRITDAFTKDADNKTFTITRGDNQASFDRTMKRWARLSYKYSDFRLVVPEKYSWFEAFRARDARSAWPLVIQIKGDIREISAEALFGRPHAESLAALVCVSCGTSATEFRDALSRKEYSISGFCQTCQDSVFGA